MKVFKDQYEKRKLVERVGILGLSMMTILTITPILLIVSYIIWKGFPAISWEFISGFPSNGMKEGGILPAIIGTIYLTIGTALFSVPLGIGAAIYLSEYASDNNVTTHPGRYYQSGGDPLSGLRPVWAGLFCAFPQFWHQHSGRITHFINHDLTHHHQYGRGSPKSGTPILPGGQYFTGRHQMADDLAGCSTRGIARHHHGNYPRARACGW